MTTIPCLGDGFDHEPELVDTTDLWVAIDTHPTVTVKTWRCRNCGVEWRTR